MRKILSLSLIYLALSSQSFACVDLAEILVLGNSRHAQRVATGTPGWNKNYQWGETLFGVFTSIVSRDQLDIRGRLVRFAYAKNPGFALDATGVLIQKPRQYERVEGIVEKLTHDEFFVRLSDNTLLQITDPTARIEYLQISTHNTHVEKFKLTAKYKALGWTQIMASQSQRFPGDLSQAGQSAFVEALIGKKVAAYVAPDIDKSEAGLDEAELIEGFVVGVSSPTYFGTSTSPNPFTYYVRVITASGEEKSFHTQALPGKEEWHTCMSLWVKTN